MIYNNMGMIPVRMIVRNKIETVEEVKRLILSGCTTASVISFELNKSISWTRQILQQMEKGAHGPENTIVCINEPGPREEKVWGMMPEDDMKVCRIKRSKWPTICPSIIKNDFVSNWIPRASERAA